MYDLEYPWSLGLKRDLEKAAKNLEGQALETVVLT